MRNPQNEKFLNKFLTKPPLIQKIEKRLEKDGLSGINIGFQEGLFLKSLCSQKHIREVVEIGTQYGCSTSWIALGLRERGTIWTLEKDPNCVIQAGISFKYPDFSKLGCRVQIIEGPALENLNPLKEQGPFDLIFIDANKSDYPNYLNWSKKNIAPGGIIIADNIFLFGSLFENQCPREISKKMWQAMNEFLKNIFKDKSFESSIIPTEDGLLMAIRKTDQTIISKKKHPCKIKN